MKKRLVCCGNYFNADRPFADLFNEVLMVNTGPMSRYDPPELTKNDVVLFGGGADISPSLYRQKPSKWSHASADLSPRDVVEKDMWERATKAGAGILGICRGAQLACALSGGSLVQHVTNHSGQDHDMTTKEGTVISVCSVHHQMMNPFATKHEIIAWASDNRSTVYLVEGEEQIKMEIEPEVVFFPETRALGIQYHPEFMGKNDEAVVYARSLVKQYLL